jgi:8-oxo-dGTP diphosphatase
VRDLRPEWLAFVGKEAYRGLFGERPELGLQQRTLGATRLFVLPSTSPANAAVPWRERLRWFQELAGRASPLPIREIVRAAVVDDDGRTVLLRYASEYEEWWTTPGGGCEPGEDDDRALRRELREELGLEAVAIGPRLWELEYWNLDEPGFSGARARVYSVRVPGFEARLLSEGLEVRWFTLDEVAAVPTRPHDLAQRLRNASGSC